MRTRCNRTNRFLAIVAVLGLWGVCTLGVAQTISNPSFEANSFTNYPGYISSNAPIIGWTSGDTNHTGLNPYAGTNNPFADNGAVPDGTNVAFIQSLGGNSSLSTVISDLVVGETYKVNFRVNARTGVGGTPNLNVWIDASNIVNSTVTPVAPAGVTNIPYKFFAFDFTAAATNQTMSLSNDASGDQTVLVDDFTIGVRNSGWSYAAWTNDASSGVDSTKPYAAYFFGASGGTMINDVTFNGVPGGNPAVSGIFSTAGLPAVYNNDTNNLTAGTGGSAVVARNFVYGGTPESITVNGLLKGNSYVATIYSVGFHGDASSTRRAATFNVGSDYLTVNQDQFGASNGIRVSYAYTATGESLTLTYVPLSGSTFHTYGFSNAQLTNAHAALLIVTNLADNGPGTLRQAIAYADAGDTITFAPALSGQTNVLTTDGLQITNNLTIDASALPAGFTISGNQNWRGFALASNVVVTLNSLTIQDGNTNGVNGAGILVSSGASLTLTNCTLSSNSSSLRGGGIYLNNTGTLTINNSTFSGNSARGGGGIDLNGGTLTINNSTFSGNSAVISGGGIMLEHGTVTINNSTFSSNSGSGGGVSIGGEGGDSGVVTINDSTFSGNSGGGGGGIFEGAACTLTINNSTISSNSAGIGGGLYLEGNCVLTNTIVAGNSAPTDTDIYGSFTGPNDLVGVNPVLAPLGNYGGPTQTMPPLPGSPAIDAGTDSVTNFLATDQRGLPRKIGAHVDIGAVEYVSVSTMVTNTADSGAGTLRDAATDRTNSVTITFAPALSGRTNILTSGQVTISVPLTIDASALSGGFTISGNNNSRVFELAGGAAVTLNSLTIQDGNINGNGGGICTDIGASLTLTNCTLSGNSGNPGGGLFFSSGALAIYNSTFSSNSAGSNSLGGGGIFLNGGTATISGSTFSSNSAPSSAFLGGGGGICVNPGSGANLALANCTLSGNSTSSGSFGGGGIFFGGTTLTVNGSTFYGNSASSNGSFGGGGILLDGGTATISGSTFSGNSTGVSLGGGISVSGGTLTIDNSTFSSNSSFAGGGIFSGGGPLTINNSTLSGNSAQDHGGGIYAAAATGTLTINNSTISSNSASIGSGLYLQDNCVLTNTIVAGNSAPFDIYGSFTGPNDLTNGNPLLAPLGNYGGPTQTMPPLPGSPAIDAGLDSVTNFLATDQRGYPRLSGAHVDIGAVELQFVAVPAPVLKNMLWTNAGGSNTFQFSFTNVSGADFTALASTNVSLPLSNWTVLGNIAEISSGQYQFVDSGTNNYPKRFYVVVSP